MIDYLKIAKSIEFYEKKGFKRIEAPWWVGEDISNITKPKDANNYKVDLNDKVLVASGEQSFLYLASKGRLLEGRYQATTPCFRHESIGSIHKKYFIKNELIDTENVSKKNLLNIIDDCYEFFSLYMKDLEIVKEKDSYDIVTKNGIELGSYGIRECFFLKWIYATGCAEPRLTRGMKYEKFLEK